MCPDTHPWAFKNGQMCCKFEYKGDGKDIAAGSTTCRNEQQIKCNGGSCKNYQGKVLPIFCLNKYSCVPFLLNYDGVGTYFNCMQFLLLDSI